MSKDFDGQRVYPSQVKRVMQLGWGCRRSQAAPPRPLPLVQSAPGPAAAHPPASVRSACSSASQITSTFSPARSSPLCEDQGIVSTPAGLRDAALGAHSRPSSGGAMQALPQPQRVLARRPQAATAPRKAALRCTLRAALPAAAAPPQAAPRRTLRAALHPPRSSQRRAAAPRRAYPEGGSYSNLGELQRTVEKQAPAAEIDPYSFRVTPESLANRQGFAVDGGTAAVNIALLLLLLYFATERIFGLDKVCDCVSPGV